MVKQRIWQSGKVKDWLMVEVYEPEFDADDMWTDRSRTMREAIKQYEELGWKKVDYLVSTNRVIAVLKKEEKGG